MKSSFLLFILLGFVYSNSFSKNKNTQHPDIQYVFIDNTISLDEIVKEKYKDVSTTYFDFGYFKERAVLKFPIKVTHTAKKHIQYQQIFINKCKLSVFKGDEKVYESKWTGSDFIKEQGVAPYFGFQNSFIFDVSLPKGEYVAYLELNSSYSPLRGRVVCFDAHPKEVVEAYITEKQSTWNVVFGFIFFACFVSILLFILSKEKIYFWFALYALINILNIYLTRGFVAPFYRFFSFYKYDIRVLMNTLWALTSFVYFYSLIPKKYTNKYIRKSILFLFIYISIGQLIFLLLPKTVSNWHLMVVLFKPILFLGFLIILIHLVIAVKKEYPMAKLFLLAYSVLFSVLFYHLFQVLNIFDDVIRRAVIIWEISVCIELLIFTFAFIYKYHQTSVEKLRLSEQLLIEQDKSLALYVKAQDEERKSIAKNIHDGILQQLVNVKQGISNFKGVANTSVLNVLDASIDELRDLSHSFMPKGLLEFGLVDAIDHLLQNSLKYVAIDSTYYHFGIEQRLSEEIEINLYRCLQELIQNTIKHSQATSIHVDFYCVKNQLILLYEDNGIGLVSKTVNYGIGLNNINSRVKMLNGSFVIENAENGGIIAIIKIMI